MSHDHDAIFEAIHADLDTAGLAGLKTAKAPKAARPSLKKRGYMDARNSLMEKLPGFKKSPVTSPPVPRSNQPLKAPAASTQSWKKPERPQPQVNILISEETGAETDQSIIASPTGHKNPPLQGAMQAEEKLEAEREESPLEALFNPDSQYTLSLEQWVSRHPVRQKLTAITGNQAGATGIALSLARQGKRVCLLELGHQDPLLQSLFEIPTDMGLSELFSNRCDLEHLVVTARRNQRVNNLYVIHQGHHPLNWLDAHEKLDALLKALQKKFHHIILSTPALSNQPRLTSLINRLGSIRVLDGATL